MSLKDQIGDLLKQALEEAGTDLAAAGEELLTYTNERIAHLQTVMGQEGFDQAVVVERDNVLLKASLAATGQADQLDARILALIQGILLIAVAAI